MITLGWRVWRERGIEGNGVGGLYKMLMYLSPAQHAFLSITKHSVCGSQSPPAPVPWPLSSTSQVLEQPDPARATAYLSGHSAHVHNLLVYRSGARSSFLVLATPLTPPLILLSQTRGCFCSPCLLTLPFLSDPEWGNLSLLPALTCLG